MEIAIDFDVSHDDRQHFLVDVNSRDPVRHWWLDSISPLPQGYCDRSPIFIAFRGPPALPSLFGRPRELPRIYFASDAPT